MNAHGHGSTSPLRGLLFNVGLGFTVALLLMLVVIGLGVTQMSHLNSELDNVVTVNNLKTRLASQMRDTHARPQHVDAHHRGLDRSLGKERAVRAVHQSANANQGPQPAGRHPPHAG